jgi:hypothetical protein
MHYFYVRFLVDLDLDLERLLRGLMVRFLDNKIIFHHLL